MSSRTVTIPAALLFVLVATIDFFGNYRLVPQPRRPSLNAYVISDQRYGFNALYRAPFVLTYQNESGFTLAGNEGTIFLNIFSDHTDLNTNIRLHDPEAISEEQRTFTHIRGTMVTTVGSGTAEGYVRQTLYFIKDDKLYELGAAYIDLHGYRDWVPFDKFLDSFEFSP